MKLNPDYKRWQEQQNGGKPATTSLNSNQALPVVSNMEDHANLSAASQSYGGPEVRLSESTNATIEMMQEPEISLAAGMKPDEMVDELGAILNKYEVPMGLMNKLMMISEFQALEFIVDDSGSMSLQTDSLDPATGRAQSRWQEALGRLKELMEILAYIPFSEIHVAFLNRSDTVVLTRSGRDPRTFLADANRKIDAAFARGPSGSTPVLQKLQDSFIKGQGKSVARYIFCDGTPDGGEAAKAEIVKILLHRPNPENNPVTFFSCTDEDAQVEWMKDAEEVAPYCSEADDFQDEAQEVLRDQGAALPYTRGFYLVCALVAASNPDDLDAMDESVPFTKATLDNLLGIQHAEESYRHYFNCFVEAQNQRIVENDDRGRPKKADQLKKKQNWQALYSEFLRAPLAKHIPAVQQFKQQLTQC